MRVTLYETAQELLSTYQNWIHEDTRERQASLRVVLYHLDESTRLLTKLSAEEGKYKNGAIVLHLDADHPDILEFIETPRSDLPLGRCVNITDELWDKFEHKDALLLGIKRGDIWLNKIRHDGENRIYGNVCLEVYLPSRGTCLLQHINLGACEFDKIPEAFTNGMSELCSLHSITGVGESGEYFVTQSGQTSWTWSTWTCQPPSKVRRNL